MDLSFVDLILVTCHVRKTEDLRIGPINRALLRVKGRQRERI